MPEHVPASRPAGGLETALRRLGAQVEVSPPLDYATLVRERLVSGAPSRARVDPGRPHRIGRPLALAVALVVALAVVLGVPRTRHAVADLLGIAGVEVHHDVPSGSVPRRSLDRDLDLGRPATLAEARDVVSFPVGLPTTSALGPPDAIYVRRELGLQSVNLVFRPRPGLPVTPGSHVGLLLSEYAGSATPYFDKYLGQGIQVEQVVVGGRWRGLYFPGEQQVLVRGPGGGVHDVYPRLSAPSLVWVEGSVTYRLEADVSRARALAIAAGVR